MLSHGDTFSESSCCAPDAQEESQLFLGLQFIFPLSIKSAISVPTLIVPLLLSAFWCPDLHHPLPYATVFFSAVYDSVSQRLV